MNRSATTTLIAAALGAIALIGGQAAAQDYPTKPIRVIVPYNPGGGTDQAARIVVDYVTRNNLLPQPLAIVNQAGAGGSIGARAVKDAEPDGYTILFHQIALLVQDANGMADFGWQDFEPIISVNSQCMVPAVRDDAPYKTYEDLIKAATDEPDTVVWGGNIGSANHMAIAAMEAAAPGAKFKKVQIGGAAEGFAALKGSVIEVANFGVGEILSFQSSGIHPLALEAAERDPALPDVPTAKELGYDAIFCNEQYFYAPKGTPDDRVAVLADAFGKALADPEVVEQFATTLGSTVMNQTGDELTQQLQSTLDRITPSAIAIRKN